MKFRIWNKMDKKFYTYNPLDTTKWLIDMNGNLGYMDLTDFSWGGLIPKGFYELNQYTGLKDKNNKEIYLGDILTCDIYPFKDNGKPNYNAEVYWDENSLQFCIRFCCVNREKRGISDGICEALTDRIDDINECQFEVIGNIYENTELLKAN